MLDDVHGGTPVSAKRRGRARGGSESFARALMREHARLRRRLPDMDPEELLNILHSIMLPWGSGRRFLLRRRDDGSYVF
jgi:hypothetical protein